MIYNDSDFRTTRHRAPLDSPGSPTAHWIGARLDSHLYHDYSKRAHGHGTKTRTITCKFVTQAGDWSRAGRPTRVKVNSPVWAFQLGAGRDSAVSGAAAQTNRC